MWRVTGAEVRRVLTLVLGGTVLSFGFALGNLYQTKKLVEPQFVKGPDGTKYVQSFDQLCGLLGEAEKRVEKQHLLYISFLRLVFAIDRIAGNYQAFQKSRKEVEQTSSMKATWRQTFVDAEHTLKTQSVTTFLTQFTAQSTPNQAIEMEELFVRVQNQVHQFVQNVWNLTD